MKVLRGLDGLPAWRSTCVCVGVFDALHPGHGAIIRATCRAARARGSKSVVISLYPHPSAVLQPGNPVPLILTLEQRLERIAALKPDYCVILPFNRKFAGMSAARFLDHVIAQRFQAEWICVGEDFRFGAGGEGDVCLLKHWARGSGITVKTFPPVLRNRQRVSSSRLRKWIRSGRVDKVRSVSGFYPEWSGLVIRGDGIGAKQMACPTLNLRVQNELWPRFGVYAGRARLCGQKTAGFPAAVHVGPRPTLGKAALRFEAHLIGRRVNWRDRPVRVQLRKFLRPIRRFDSPEALKAQIQKDISKARLF